MKETERTEELKKTLSIGIKKLLQQMELNCADAEAKKLIRQKHGVSTRHLQGYLD